MTAIWFCCIHNVKQLLLDFLDVFFLLEVMRLQLLKEVKIGLQCWLLGLNLYQQENMLGSSCIVICTLNCFMNSSNKDLRFTMEISGKELFLRCKKFFWRKSLKQICLQQTSIVELCQIVTFAEKMVSSWNWSRPPIASVNSPPHPLPKKPRFIIRCLQKLSLSQKSF